MGDVRNVQILNEITYSYTNEGLLNITKCMNNCSDTHGCKSITITTFPGSEICYLYYKKNVDTSEAEVFGSISANKECFDEIEGIELLRINLIFTYFIIFCSNIEGFFGKSKFMESLNIHGKFDVSYPIIFARKMLISLIF